jgi:hypothetical protein
MLQGPSRSDFHARLAPVLRADPTRKGDTDARERNTRARPPGQGRRQVAFHASGRIRARRDGARARREARGAIHETGDRDRSVEGAAVRGPAAVAPQGTSVFADSGEGLARPSKRKDGKDPTEVPEAVAGGFESASPRGPLRRLPQVALPAGPVERPETRRRAPVCRRAPGGADPEETLLVSPPIRSIDEVSPFGPRDGMVIPRSRRVDIAPVGMPRDSPREALRVDFGTARSS